MQAESHDFIILRAVEWRVYCSYLYWYDICWRNSPPPMVWPGLPCSFSSSRKYVVWRNVLIHGTQKKKLKSYPLRRGLSCVFTPIRLLFAPILACMSFFLQLFASFLIGWFDSILLFVLWISVRLAFADLLLTLGASRTQLIAIDRSLTHTLRYPISDSSPPSPFFFSICDVEAFDGESLIFDGWIRCQFWWEEVAPHPWSYWCGVTNRRVSSIRRMSVKSFKRSFVLYDLPVSMLLLLVIVSWVWNWFKPRQRSTVSVTYSKHSSLSVMHTLNNRMKHGPYLRLYRP